MGVPVAIHRTTLSDGSKVARVPIAGGACATIDQADLDRLASLGLTLKWVFNDAGRGNRYVRTRFPAALGNANNIQVARAIMAPPPGCVVKHRDGDPLNLRRKNLMVVRQGSQAKARERLWEPQCAA
jgi:hypothetical protein